MMWNFYGSHMYLFGLIILVIIAIVVANDANSTGRNGLLWGLVTLFLPMMGLLAYLVVRSFPVTPTNSVVRTTPVTPTQQVVYQPVAQPEPITQPSGKQQFCITCGASNVAEAQFCNSCGAKIFHG